MVETTPEATDSALPLPIWIFTKLLIRTAPVLRSLSVRVLGRCSSGAQAVLARCRTINPVKMTQKMAFLGTNPDPFRHCTNNRVALLLHVHSAPRILASHFLCNVFPRRGKSI